MHHYRPSRILCDAAVLCLLLVSLARGASATAATDKGDSLDEVVVEATRSQLDHIRQEMVLVEDRFYERYNELNTKHDFDTHCHIEARIGTNTKRRYCRALYQERAQQREGHDYAEALKDMTQDPPQPWVPPTTPTIMIEARRKDYQNNIREVVKRNPELVDMLRERYELGLRYEATRRKVFGLKPATEPEATNPPAPVAP
jgi:hypothetical protein